MYKKIRQANAHYYCTNTHNHILHDKHRNKYLIMNITLLLLQCCTRSVVHVHTCMYVMYVLVCHVQYIIKYPFVFNLLFLSLHESMNEYSPFFHHILFICTLYMYYY